MEAILLGIFGVVLGAFLSFAFSWLLDSRRARIEFEVADLRAQQDAAADLLHIAGQAGAYVAASLPVNEAIVDRLFRSIARAKIYGLPTGLLERANAVRDAGWDSTSKTYRPGAVPAFQVALRELEEALGAFLASRRSEIVRRLSADPWGVLHGDERAG